MEEQRSERKMEDRRRTEDRRKQEMSADAGIRTRVLTLARLSDNQLHYVHTGKAWIHSSNIKITECAEPCPRPMSGSGKDVGSPDRRTLPKILTKDPIRGLLLFRG